MRARHDNYGFTLIEAVVATAVFAFFIASILGVYMATLRLDSRTRAQRAVTDNARFIMEFIAKEVRNGHIDYSASACGSTVTSVTDLCLVNQDGQAEHIYAASVSALNTSTGTDLVIDKNGSSSNLNSSTVTITALKLLVSPNVDPLTPLKVANEQPHVTVLLSLKAKSSKDPVVMNLESTFSENYYPAR